LGTGFKIRAIAQRPEHAIATGPRGSVENNGYHLRHDNTGQDTTTCAFQGESVAQLGARMKQPRRLARPFFRAGDMMTALFDQKQLHGVARLVGMRSALNIVTSTVEKKPASKEMAVSFLTRSYEKLPFALRGVEVHKQIEERQRKIIGGLSHAAGAEPIATTQKIRCRIMLVDKLYVKMYKEW
jgi:hypothetical protein